MRSALVVCALLLSGCATAVLTGAASSDDGRIRAAVIERLRSDPALGGVEVESRNSVVTLRGQVPSRSAGSRAVRSARGVAGVKDVIDRMLGPAPDRQ